MSLLNQSYSPEFMASLSEDDKVTLAKRMIVEYHKTHTKEEYAQFLDWLNYTVAKDRH